MVGVLVGNFGKNNPKRYKFLFYGRGLNSHLRGANSYITHYLLSYFFWLNTLKAGLLTGCTGTGPHNSVKAAQFDQSRTILHNF